MIVKHLVYMDVEWFLGPSLETTRCRPDVLSGETWPSTGLQTMFGHVRSQILEIAEDAMSAQLFDRTKMSIRAPRFGTRVGLVFATYNEPKRIRASASLLCSALSRRGA